MLLDSSVCANFKLDSNSDALAATLLRLGADDVTDAFVVKPLLLLLDADDATDARIVTLLLGADDVTGDVTPGFGFNAGLGFGMGLGLRLALLPVDEEDRPSEGSTLTPPGTLPATLCRWEPLSAPAVT